MKTLNRNEIKSYFSTFSSILLFLLELDNEKEIKPKLFLHCDILSFFMNKYMYLKKRLNICIMYLYHDVSMCHALCTHQNMFLNIFVNTLPLFVLFEYFLNC